MSQDDLLLKFFGENVRETRRRKLLSQEDLSLQCGLDQTCISDVELGKRNISLFEIASIADALAIPVAKLFLGFPSSNAQTTETPASKVYKIRDAFQIECGFAVSGEDIAEAAILSSAQLEALPFTLFQCIDLKSLSGVVGALFASNLAKRVGAIVNPIEKGHPDILPAAAVDASEAELRKYPQGLEIKCTVGNVAKGSKLQPGEPRLKSLSGITWQAHHREVTGFLGLVIDFAGTERDGKQFPVITAAYFTNELEVDDWGAISGTTGRNTKVTGLRSTGKGKLAKGWVIVFSKAGYDKYCKYLPVTEEIAGEDE